MCVNSWQIQLAVINASNAVSVKDVPAREFIEAFAKHLKKGNKFKIPDVSTRTSLLRISLFPDLNINYI